MAYEIQCIHYLANEINCINNDIEKILVLVEKLDNKNQSQEVLLNEIRKELSHAEVVQILIFLRLCLTFHLLFGNYSLLLNKKN